MSKALEIAGKLGTLDVKFEVGTSLPGGLVIYGDRFGPYPLDP
jgi:hypothetical protein